MYNILTPAFPLVASVTPPDEEEILQGYINGFQTAKNGVDSLDIGAGVCRDDADTDKIEQTTTLTKTRAAFAPGNNAGGCSDDIPSAIYVDNTFYYVYAIKRSDTQAVDQLISISPTAPQLPTGWDITRLHWMFYYDSSAIVPYEQSGDQCSYADAIPSLDESSPAANVWTPHAMRGCPPVENVEVIMQMGVRNTTASQIKTCAFHHGIGNAPSQRFLGLYELNNFYTTTNAQLFFTGYLLVDSLAQIRYQPDSNANIRIFGRTAGWKFSRGKS